MQLNYDQDKPLRRSLKITVNTFLPGVLVYLMLILPGCGSKQSSGSDDHLFNLLEASETGIDFKNQLSYYKDFNIFTYRNFYNGGGVAIGDVNNDGLPDIYFTSNLQANKLYLNKGNLKFQDVTDRAGVKGTKAWSTGVTMADVNGDGWLDIYVCNSGYVKGDDHRNELFINNKDGSFAEQAAEYGLDDPGFSNHASFFDYDNDGDLDVYIINNSFQSAGSIDQTAQDRSTRDPMGGDKLLKNNDGKFIDVSKEAHIYGSVIGFGLGVMVSDLNQDGWLDIYVCNDFFERDYIYMNQGDGTFIEDLPAKVQSINQASMGVDAADITGDGYPEIFVTEMLPKSEERFKTTMIYEDWETYLVNFKNDYYHQFTRNTFQLNNRETGTDGISFSEIGRYAGIEATDWSWSGLIVDLDNNGKKDIFVTNGIYQDILDQDFITRLSNDLVLRDMLTKKDIDYRKLIDAIPSNPVSNFVFSGGENYLFADSTASWGLSKPGFSNGAAYGDLDNDGDLDLVINNVNFISSVYENKTSQNLPDNHYLKIKLVGNDKNTHAIGAKVKAYADDKLFQMEQVPSRGFQSSVDYQMVIGLGKEKKIDSLIVVWSGGKLTKLEGISSDQEVEIREEDSIPDLGRPAANKSWYFTEITKSLPDELKHTESEFNDFKATPLLFHMNSTEGPGLAVGDVNGDRLDDIYIGGAKGHSGKMFIQKRGGGYVMSNSELFEKDELSEDLQVQFFDADGDSDPDLYATSGSDEVPPNSPALCDRLYLNDGKGNFKKSSQMLPVRACESTSCVSSCDFDEDGDMDLFVGVRMEPGNYGRPQNGYIYENVGGEFKDVTEKLAPDLLQIGMIKDAIWTDFDNDGHVDLVIVGEWMTIRLFKNLNGTFTEVTASSGLEKYHGWWNTIKAADIDGDGDVDFIAGNHGLNSRFKASFDQPITMHVSDFDNNGVTEQIISKFNGRHHIPFAQNHDLIKQIPSLFYTFKELEDDKTFTLEDIFDDQQINKSVVLNATYMQSAVILNNGDGKFSVEPLPIEAQFSPVYAILVDDVDNDGIPDILLGGNLYEVKPEVGRYDASYSQLLKGLGNGKFLAIPDSKAGLNIQGQVRDIKISTINSEKVYLFVQNNDRVKAFKWNGNDRLSDSGDLASSFH